MDWSNERYVRVYTRDTTTWKLLDWRARTVLLHLFRKVDRAGVLDVGADGVLGLAAVLELPFDIVEPGIAYLAASRGGGVPTVIATGSAYVLPRFLEAQEAPQSDAQRQRESRSRRRDLALTPVTVPRRFVTSGHESGWDRHDNREPVTPSQTSQTRIRIGGANSDSPLVTATQEITHVVKTTDRGRAGKHDPTPAERDIAARVLAKLSEYSKIRYRGSDKHVGLIARHLRAGVTEHDLRAVVALQAADWEDDPKMRKYLRPETLFGIETIEKYLDAARTEYARELAALEPAAQPTLALDDGGKP